MIGVKRNKLRKHFSDFQMGFEATTFRTLVRCLTTDQVGTLVASNGRLQTM